MQTDTKDLIDERKKQQLHADMLADRAEDDYLPLESLFAVQAIKKEIDDDKVVEARKKGRLADDMKHIEEEGKFVPLSEIKD